MHTPGQSTPNQRHYWQKDLRLTAWLMLVWTGVTFGVAFFARDLNFTFFGWPFSFWVGAQGALMVYVILIWFYARTMNKLDAAHSLGEE